MAVQGLLLSKPDNLSQQPTFAGISSDTHASSLIVAYSKRWVSQFDLLPPLLLPFASQGKPEELPYAFTDYLMLVDWTGRAIRPDKRGHIPARLGPILERLGLDGVRWLKQVVLFRRQGIRVVGDREQCQQFANHCGQRRCHQPLL